jgi:broad specificity phosphatase PhoE
MSVEIIYETHSTTTDNENGIATGWLAGRLSDLGISQARELGDRRRGEDIDVVFVSDLVRAVQTAELAFPEAGIPIHEDARLRECNYGLLNGAPVSEVAAERRRRVGEPFPEGQSYRQVVDQTRTFLRDLLDGCNGKKVVVIAHSANKWALDHIINGTDLETLVESPFDWQPGWRYVLSEKHIVDASE